MLDKLSKVPDITLFRKPIIYSSWKTQAPKFSLALKSYYTSKGSKIVPFMLPVIHAKKKLVENKKKAHMAPNNVWERLEALSYFNPSSFTSTKICYYWFLPLKDL